MVVLTSTGESNGGGDMSVASYFILLATVAAAEITIRWKACSKVSEGLFTWSFECDIRRF